ncbi:MAG: NAD(P)H-binding protein [Cyanobacteriota bacterium]|nr:NAD(P)H-binding protein [Cyanobacteriota bacterium]
MNVLVVGATGTLGRQVVRRALEEGHQVTSLVRNPAKAAFLSEWGSHLKVGNLCRPETLPDALVGMDALIDCATVRSTDSLSAKQVDWDGKVALINAARAAQIQRYVFFSIMGADKEYANVPLMNFKHHTEKYLVQAQMPYTIFRLCGFMQGLIGQYALPILEEQLVWITNQSVPTAYMNTQDIARFAVQSLQIEATRQQVFPLAGPKAWKPREIIQLCEQLSNRKAKISTMPLGLLRGSRKVAQFFQWSWNIADRLAFVEVLAAEEPMDADMTQVYEIFGLDPASMNHLEDYLGEYFQKMLRRLREQKVKKPKVSSPF